MRILPAHGHKKGIYMILIFSLRLVHETTLGWIGRSAAQIRLNTKVNKDRLPEHLWSCDAFDLHARDRSGCSRGLLERVLTDRMTG